MCDSKSLRRNYFGQDEQDCVVPQVILFILSILSNEKGVSARMRGDAVNDR